MRRTPLALLRVIVALSLVLPTSCVTSRKEVSDGVRSRMAPQGVKVSKLPGGQLRLSFEPGARDPSLEVLEVEKVRAVLEAFHGALPPEAKPRFQLLLASTSEGGKEHRPAGWERQLRQEYLSRYGPPLLPLPDSLEESSLFLALKLSPRYMGAGAREAAQELFSSPAFLAGVALSVALYFSAWLLPEPVFSKAFAAALTVRLALAVGLLELGRVAWACLRLYQEAAAARTAAELEAAAEHFGRTMGGTALRVLVLVASMGVGKGLPQVPQGGLWSLLGLGSPRYAVAGGLTMEGATTVHIVADGTLVVTGAAVGTATAALGSACTDGSEKKEGYQWHHLATDKNDTSTLHGGPWTPLFKILFAQAGMGLDAVENVVYLHGHIGPHPEEYHREIYRRLKAALEDCRTPMECRGQLAAELKKVASEICTPGSLLHRLATKQ
ncbi:AHH domain-containing protein [Archangium violaceum]|uniref:AHH domain-containing protein n=1 Tax=Archangium violaceum TaxID=83451 RepID=UPI0019500D26|nr:AHH domain-containing protein [Archangium violaceum]